jgi:hypothetical protein
MSARSDGFARTDQCHDKHARGRREQLRNPFRHREVQAEQRDLGGVFVDEDKDQQDEYNPAAPTLTPAHVLRNPQSACVWRRPDRTVQLFRLPRTPLCGGGRRWGLRSPAAVMSSSGGVKDSWASARPRRRRSKSAADASRSMSTTPSAQSWKFPVSKMKHYLTWWANSMQSRAIPCGHLECCEIDQQTTKRQCMRLQALLTVVARVLGGKKDLGANIRSCSMGQPTGKKPDRIVESVVRLCE